MLSQSGQWIIFGVRSDIRNGLPFEAISVMIEKNLSLRGFNLEGSLHQVPKALSALFELVGEGKLKLEITDILSARQPGFTNSLKRAKPPGKSHSFRRSEETNHVLQHIDLAAP